MKNILLLFTLILCLPQAVLAQNKNLQGVVRDEANLPMVGVVVYGDESQNSTITGDDGVFTLSVSNRDQFLCFQMIGYEELRVKIKGDSYEVRLKESTQMLEESISVGYSTKTKSSLTGAVQAVDLEDAEMRSVTTSSMLLAGKSAGLTITQNSAQPGSDEPEIIIRGASSIGNSNTPLIIIDGVEGSLSGINPHDIESMSVLKDASSAALYGSRAAAGVIIVTTKRGEKGVKFSYNGSYSVQTWTCLPDVVNDVKTYMDMSNLAFQNSRLKIKFPESTYDKWLAAETPSYTPVENWRDLYFGIGMMHNHYVNLSGAGKNYDFAFSTGYNGQEGLLYSTSADKFNYRLKLNVSFFDNFLQLGTIISGNDNENFGAQSASSIISRYNSNRPTLFHKCAVLPGVYGGGSAVFAINELGGGVTNKSKNQSATYTVTLNPFKGFKIVGSYSMNKGNSLYQNYQPTYYTAASVESTKLTKRRSTLSKTHGESIYSVMNALASYKIQLGGNTFSLLGGIEARETRNMSDRTLIYDLMTNQPILSYGDLTTISLSSTDKEYATLSYFGSFSYSYKNRYYLDGNIRWDGSSRFAESNRWGYFPSVSGAWRVSNEPFMQSVEWIDNLKVKASWGQLGNDRMSDYYVFADQFSSSLNYAFNNAIVAGTGTTKLANLETSWETVTQKDFGLEFDFCKNYSLSIDLFDKLTTDMLTNTYLPLSIGVGQSSPYQNVGSIRNKGIELTAGYSKQLTKDLFVSADINMSYINNKVESLGENDDFWHTSDGTVRSLVGMPYQSYFGYEVERLYQLYDFTWQNESDSSIPYEERNYVLKEGITTTSLHSNVQPGDLLIKNQTEGDNNITTDDVVYLGCGRAKYHYSFNFNVKYKAFDFRVLATGQGKSNVLLYNPNFTITSFLGQLQTSFVNNHWTEETPQYRMLYADKPRRSIISSYDIHNGAYLRIKNVQLGYTFPKNLTDKIRIGGLRLFLSAENLFTLTKFPKDFDPERLSTNFSPFASYPMARTFTGGLIINI